MPRVWGAVVAVVWLSAGCAVGGATDESGDQTATTTHDATTTTAVPTTSAPPPPTTTVPAPAPTSVPPYSFDGSVPPPPLENTGDDFDRIYRSLDAYTHWLLAHNPDVELLNEAVAPSSRLYANSRDDIELLVSNELRMYDSDSVVTRVEVRSLVQGPGSVTRIAALQVWYTDDRRVLVRHDGSEQDSERLPDQSRFNVMLTEFGGRWRMQSVEAVPDDVVVEL